MAITAQTSEGHAVTGEFLREAAMTKTRRQDVHAPDPEVT
jgi:hypothetical protein